MTQRFGGDASGTPRAQASGLCDRKIRGVRRMISFGDRVTVPSNILIRFLDQESVILNLNTEKYFGLDAVGTRMWQLVTSSPTIDAAFFQLIEEYDVEPATLRIHLAELLEHLLDNGLIATQAADVGTPSTV
jgi:hypothetical protein